MTDRDIIVAHSSDLHIGANSQIDRFHPLCKVLETARQASADLLILAGDVFDHNRLPIPVLDQTCRRLDDAPFPIVILPGNHDCITPESVYRRGGIQDVPNVTVIGLEAESFTFSDLDLQVWGKAHFDYQNMSPLSAPHARGARWQIAVAHGHYLAEPQDRHRGWLFDDDDIASTQADYVALGHWPGATAVGTGAVPAYYCGSPDLAGTINVVRLSRDGSVEVRRGALANGDHP
jgi:DNA repair exonuclease SbcCD nuclease subunit